MHILLFSGSPKIIRMCWWYNITMNNNAQPQRTSLLEHWTFKFEIIPKKSWLCPSPKLSQKQGYWRLLTLSIVLSINSNINFFVVLACASAYGFHVLMLVLVGAFCYRKSEYTHNPYSSFSSVKQWSWRHTISRVQWGREERESQSKTHVKMWWIHNTFQRQELQNII